MNYRLFATQTRGLPGPNRFGRMFGHTFCYELDFQGSSQYSAPRTEALGHLN